MPLKLMVLAALSVALVEWAGHAGLLDGSERRLQDLQFQLQGRRDEQQQVAIVAIDEDSLARYPDDPMLFWTDRLAVAVERLRQVGVPLVGLDMLYSISPERWLSKLDAGHFPGARDYDRAFRAQLASGQLLLVASRSGAGAAVSDYLLPSPDYLLALPDYDLQAHVGLADLLVEGDGLVRRYRVMPVAAAARAQLQDELPQLSLPALLAVRAGGQDVRAAAWQLAGRSVWPDQPAAVIPYLGPPGTFHSVPLHRLLADDALNDPEVQALRGKLVLLGATAAGLNDAHFTPFSSDWLGGRSLLMSGVEVHANVLQALLSGSYLRSPDSGWRVLGLLLLSTIAVACLLRPPVWTTLLLWLLGLVLLLVLAQLLFRLGWLMPLSAAGLVLSLSFFGVLGLRLTGEERERNRLRQMFGRYVSEQVVEALLRSGERPELGGQTQRVTVLFSDIRNFTSISERLTAKEVVEMLNAYFARACEPLLAEGGSIDKFIGDAVMVEFGSPVPLDDHAQRAVRAALALKKVAEEFAGWMQQRFPGRDLPAFAVGIGLHSGEAVLGNIGSPVRMEFTAIGDTVNLASRLEGMTKELGCAILASAECIAEAGERVRCGRSEVIRVKGREAPIQVFEVIGWHQGDPENA
ncbi:CHASE2 domain-containing protein [Pseudomonas sp.]|uniref:CHASE2 domain-containing protein n=1 Tax=Pseudomonas sp. TaxID=306 RepID=UPI003C759A63